jgi:hypothetical protein
MESAYQNSPVAIESSFSVRGWVYYSTLAGVFSSALVLQIGFGLQLFYLLLLENVLLLILLQQFAIPKRLLWLGAYLLASGVIGIRCETDTVGLVAKQLLGILISAFFFYNFFRLPGNSFEQAFQDYAIAAYWVAILGFFMFPLEWATGRELRLQSVFSEPAMFATVCLPAAYYFANEWRSHRRYGRQLAVMLMALAFAVSSVGYLGIAFGLYLFLSGYRYCKVIAPVLIAGLIGALLYVSPPFRLRAIDTVTAIQNSDLEGANLSTFALISNMFVTERVFEDSPILGHGIGSHPISHERYLAEIPAISSFAAMDSERINAEDAASLFLRVTSEFGIVGLIGVFVFIWHYRVPGQGPRAQISFAILIYFFLKLLRGGHYFSPEQFFFILIYILNYRHFKAEMQTKAISANA